MGTYPTHLLELRKKLVGEWIDTYFDNNHWTTLYGGASWDEVNLQWIIGGGPPEEVFGVIGDWYVDFFPTKFKLFLYGDEPPQNVGVTNGALHTFCSDDSYYSGKELIMDQPNSEYIGRISINWGYCTITGWSFYVEGGPPPLIVQPQMWIVP